MEQQPVVPAPSKPGNRISLACAQCRSRHLRCDAVKPACSRCQGSASQCTYLKSRRGRRCNNAQSLLESGPSSISSLRLSDNSSSHGVQNRSTQRPGQSLTVISGCSSTANSLAGGSSIASEIASASRIGNNQDALLELYYLYFHKAHPCVLPSQSLKQRLSEDIPGMRLLVLVMQFIGSLYACKQRSVTLEDQVARIMAEQQSCETGFEVQALILYSTVVYWCDERVRARRLLDLATTKAIALGMNTKNFAIENSHGDPVLAESWRRTWWLLYIIDAHMAATDHAVTFATSQKTVPCDVDLPCDEDEFQSGNIPMPKSLEDYDLREFAFENELRFSSFAYAVGLLRSLDCIVLSIPRSSEEYLNDKCLKADASVSAWYTLLDKSKRNVFKEDGTVDYLIVMAHLMIEVYMVDIHRPLSTCVFSPIEAISSCAPPPPPERLAPVYCRDAPLHTAKILQAIERLTNMLTLPTSIGVWSPFIICIIATTTIAHLSACKFVLKGEQLTVARERIRVAMGALESFAEVWPGGKRTVREIKTIARELLCLGSAATPEMSTDNAAALSTTSQTRGGGLATEPDYYVGFDWSGYFNVPDLDTPQNLDLGDADLQNIAGYQFAIATQI